jgi:hypothetical protein
MTTGTTAIITRQIYSAHADTTVMLLLSSTVLMPSVRVVVPGVPMGTSPCLCATASRGPLRVGHIDSGAYRAPETAPVVHLGSARRCLRLRGARGFCRELHNVFYHEVITHVGEVDAIGGCYCLKCLHSGVNGCSWDTICDTTSVQYSTVSETKSRQKFFKARAKTNCITENFLGMLYTRYVRTVIGLFAAARK